LTCAGNKGNPMRCNPMSRTVVKRCVRLAAAGMLILLLPAAASFAQAADPAAAVAARCARSPSICSRN
jgi:hypothetical protein